jgi:hypothetical protein
MRTNASGPLHAGLERPPLLAPTRRVLASFVRYAGLAAGGELRLRKQRLGHSYRLFDGRHYRVFRETVTPLAGEQRTAIEVGFRLRLIGSAAAPH